MSDDDNTEIPAWRGESRDEGWSFVVILFRGQPSGEIRVARGGVEQFRAPMGIEEIAVFAAEREDLVAQYLDGLIAQHRAH